MAVTVATELTKIPINPATNMFLYFLKISEYSPISRVTLIKLIPIETSPVEIKESIANVKAIQKVFLE